MIHFENGVSKFVALARQRVPAFRNVVVLLWEGKMGGFLLRICVGRFLLYSI